MKINGSGSSRVPFHWNGLEPEKGRPNWTGLLPLIPEKKNKGFPFNLNSHLFGVLWKI